MAEKRMFTKKITDADAFIGLSSSAQALYLHLCQGADDDGFNNQIQMAMYKAHASTDDLKALLGNRFIIQFESGVIVIKHWRMHNVLRKDRYTETAFQDEFKQLKVKDNGAYTINRDLVADWLPNGCQVVAVDKDSIDKVSIDKSSIYNCSKKFDEFWALYPKKQSKATAKKIFERLNPSDELFKTMLSALEKFKETNQWKKDNGQFIPLPSTWLNQRRWEDELSVKVEEKFY